MIKVNRITSYNVCYTKLLRARFILSVENYSAKKLSFMDKFSFLGNSEIESIDQLYQQYLQDPESVDVSFQDFFKGFEFALKNYKPVDNQGLVNKEFNVANLILGYRQRGHLFTKTNPVRTRRKYYPTLDIENFGLSKDDLNTVFQAGYKIGLGPATLTDIIDHLEETRITSYNVCYTKLLR